MSKHHGGEEDMAGKQQRIALTEEFINQFREERSLWDITSPLYRCKDARHSSIRRITAKIQMSENEVKRKINALRTYFSRELAKSSAMIPGRETIYESKWPHYQSLMFLRETITPRRTTLSVCIQDRSCHCEECLAKEGYATQNGGSQCLLEVFDDDVAEYNGAQKRRSTMQPVKEKRRKTEITSKEDRVPDETVPVLAAAENNAIDADDVFGQHVTASLRSIKETKSKEYIKVKIQELIFQAQFGMLPMPPRQANINPGPSAFSLICPHLVHTSAIKNQGDANNSAQSSTCVDI